jgi:hypothetical protein
MKMKLKSLGLVVAAVALVAAGIAIYPQQRNSQETDMPMYCAASFSFIAAGVIIRSHPFFRF